jgi:cell division protein FtsA
MLMQESSRYAVGIDIGTTTIRCVVGHIDASTGTPTIVGVGCVPNSGMRKGSVANLAGPARAIDDALGEAERMSGYQVDSATISINGSHILSTTADGMIAVGAADHEITHDDLARIEEVATIGKVPPNREILEVVPHSYRLDGQDNIKDPLGMTGTRLEINANVISALTPHLTNLQKTAEMAKVAPRVITPAVLAAARAVLGESQLESGVAVIDLGGATTSVAVFEEGDLQFVGVVPLGGMNITNDLAIGLKTDPEVAEKVKLAHASAVARSKNEKVTIKHDKETLEFSTSDIDEIVEARLEEIFEAVHKELKKAGRAGQLPSGVVLTGGTAQLKGIIEYAKTALGLAAKIGAASGYGGVAEHLGEPQFAAAVGLMLIDAEGAPVQQKHSAQNGRSSALKAVKGAGGFLSGLFGRFKT